MSWNLTKNFSRHLCGSRRDQEEGGSAGISQRISVDTFAGPGEIKRREVVLDPQVSPEELKSREVELGSQSWTSFASVVFQQRTLSL